MSRLLKWCTCLRCLGGKWVAKSTYFAHQSLRHFTTTPSVAPARQQLGHIGHEQEISDQPVGSQEHQAQVEASIANDSNSDGTSMGSQSETDSRAQGQDSISQAESTESMPLPSEDNSDHIEENGTALDDQQSQYASQHSDPSHPICASIAASEPEQMSMSQCSESRQADLSPITPIFTEQNSVRSASIFVYSVAA